MRRFAAIVFLIGCGGSDLPGVGSTLQGATQGQPTVLHSNWNGGNAQANFGAFMTGANGGYVDIWQNSGGGGGGAGTGGGTFDGGTGTSTTLSYSYFANDPTSQQCFSMGMFSYCFYTRFSYECGYGSIPSSDADINARTASVNTTVTASATFFISHCDVDYNMGIFNCGNGGGGAINVRWVKTNAYSTFNSGVSRSDYGPMSFKTQGQWTSTSASASGTVVGQGFTDAPGSLGTTRGNSVIKELSGPNPFPDGGTM